MEFTWRSIQRGQHEKGFEVSKSSGINEILFGTRWGAAWRLKSAHQKLSGHMHSLKIIGCLIKKKLLLLHAHVEFIPSDERKLLNLFDSAYRRMCFSSLLGKRMRKTDESSDGEEFTLRSCSPAHIKCLHLQQIEAADKVKFSSGESRKVHQTPVLTFAYVESFF